MLSGTPRIACKPFRDRIADFSLRIDYDGAPAVHVEHVSRDIDGARLSHLGDEVKYDLAIRSNATRDAHRFDHRRGRLHNALGRCAARPDEMEMNDMRRMSHEPAERIRLPNHLLRTRWPTRFRSRGRTSGP